MLFLLLNIYLPTRKRYIETGEPKNLKLVLDFDRRARMDSLIFE